MTATVAGLAWVKFSHRKVLAKESTHDDDLIQALIADKNEAVIAAFIESASQQKQETSALFPEIKEE